MTTVRLLRAQGIHTFGSAAVIIIQLGAGMVSFAQFLHSRSPDGRIRRNGAFGRRMEERCPRWGGIPLGHQDSLRHDLPPFDLQLPSKSANGIDIGRL